MSEVATLLRTTASLQAAGRIRESIEPLQRALLLAPADAGAHLNLGRALCHCGQLDTGIASLRRGLALDPGNTLGYLHLGLALERAGQAAEAIKAYQQAVALAPKLADAHVRLSDLFFRTGQRPHAARHLLLAADAMPDTTAGRLHRVRGLMLEENYTSAEDAVRTALKSDPANAEANRLLATMLSRNGQFPEAIAHFERAVKADPRNATAYMGLVRAKKITDADRPLIARMAALTSDRLPNDQQMQLHFALGKAFDDLNDPAAAWDHFSAANRLRRGRIAPDRGAAVAIVDRMIATFTHASTADVQGNSDATPLFIVGMPRSGTTLVEQIVSSHPHVAAGGELRFWTSAGPRWLEAGQRMPSTAEAGRLAAEYLAMLRRIGPSAIRVTDKNPFNFLWIGLIRTVFPKARIVHCLRDPVDTCVSIFTTHFASPMQFASDQDDLVFFYRQYRRMMAHWRSLPGTGDFIEVQYERLIAEPEQETRRLIEAAGLHWDDACLRPEQNKRAVNTASLWQARQPINTDSLARWRRYEPWIERLLTLRDDA